MHNNRLLKTLQKRSFVIGVISSIVGCAIFIIVEESRMMVTIGHKIDLQISLLIFVLGTALAFFPAGGGGVLLASMLYADAVKEKLSVKIALLKGSLLGGTAGILIMLAGGILANWRGSTSVFLFHAFEVILLSMLAGCVTGIGIVKFISRKSDSMD